MRRPDFVAQVIARGWTLVSLPRADEGFVVAEARGRYQLTGWFVASRSTRLGRIDLFDMPRAEDDVKLGLLPRGCAGDREVLGAAGPRER